MGLVTINRRSTVVKKNIFEFNASISFFKNQFEFSIIDPRAKILLVKNIIGRSSHNITVLVLL